MRNKGNGQFRRFLFQAGGAAHDHRVFVGVKLIVPAALKLIKWSRGLYKWRGFERFQRKNECKRQEKTLKKSSQKY